MSLIKTKNNNFKIITFFIFSIALFFISLGCNGNDYWWHFKIGEYITNTGEIPKTGIFSWYAIENNLKWISHEWGFEYILYNIQNIFGQLFTYIFFSLLLSLCCILPYILNKKGFSENPYYYLLCGTFSTLSIFSLFFIRPHILSYLLLIFLFKILIDFYNDENKKTIYFMPLIAILWSNIHGGSSNIVYIFGLLFTIVSCINLNYMKLECKRKTKKQILIFLILTIISTALLILNPHGIDILTFPYEVAGSNTAKFLIDEWKSPDLKDLGNLIHYIVLFIPAISFVLTDKKIKLIDILIYLFFAALFFRSVRFISFIAILTPFIVKEYNLNTKNNKIVNKILIYLTITIFFVSGYLFFSQKTYNYPIKNAFENKEIIKIIKNDNPQKLANTYNFGGYLIMNDINVFFDEREDMYSPAGIFDDGINLFHTNTDPEQIIKKYNFDAFLCSVNDSLSLYLNKYPDKYKLLYKDEEVLYYKKIVEE